MGSQPVVCCSDDGGPGSTRPPNGFRIHLDSKSGDIVGEVVLGGALLYFGLNSLFGGKTPPPPSAPAHTSAINSTPVSSMSIWEEGLSLRLSSVDQIYANPLGQINDGFTSSTSAVLQQRSQARSTGVDKSDYSSPSIPGQFAGRNIKPPSFQTLGTAYASYTGDSYITPDPIDLVVASAFPLIGAMSGASVAITEASESMEFEYARVWEHGFEHVFEAGDQLVKHNLESLVDEFGSQEAAYDAIRQATADQLSFKGVESGVFREFVDVGGTELRVHGRVESGLLDISTAFKPKPGQMLTVP